MQPQLKEPEVAEEDRPEDRTERHRTPSESTAPATVLSPSAIFASSSTHTRRPNDSPLTNEASDGYRLTCSSKWKDSLCFRRRIFLELKAVKKNALEMDDETKSL